MDLVLPPCVYQPPLVSAEAPKKRLKLQEEEEEMLPLESKSEEEEEEEEMLSDSDSKPEAVVDESEEEEKEMVSDSDSETEPLPERNMDINDFKRLYDDRKEIYHYVCDRFEYKNPAQIRRDQEIEKARAEFEREKEKNPSAFDTIGAPGILGLCGCVCPYTITDNNRPNLIHLCKLALKEYNDKDQGADFVFVDLVKATYRAAPGNLYYITFQAKSKDLPNSNSSAVTFQAQVWDRMPSLGSPVVKSCSIKTT